ncbi:SH3 domain-containing protein [Favolaschia claudopus]|uniref:SH3 domain-containing protein n=1 Tax=Favolaschia claudopus TaxID=2862362 RepID=A0AAW0E2M2_9AGAR
MQWQGQPQPEERQTQGRRKTADGRTILHYVRAAWDFKGEYQDELDFKAGDIIAVTDTSDKDWWSGELLEASKRVPGKHLFPCNYTEPVQNRYEFE